MRIGELPALCARRYPRKNATVWHGRAQTFTTFNERVNRLVGALADMGLGKGSKIGVLSRNRPEVLEVFFAAAKAGIVLVPINFRLQAQEFRFVIHDAGLQALVVGPDYREVIASIQGEIDVEHVLDLERDYEPLLANHAPGEPEITTAGDDLFAIFYTSGTTGGPKGVMLSHDNFLSAVINHLIGYQLGPADVCLHVMPFYHTMEASMAICQFYVGGSNVIVDAFDGQQFWTLVKDHGVTHITLVHTMLKDVMDAYDRGGCELGNFRFFSVGGQATPTELIRRTLTTLGPGRILHVYGLTEASPLITYLPKEDVSLDRPELFGSVGKEFFSCQVRVVDEKDQDVPPGTPGEIIARGPNVMQGYWKRAEETAATLRGGWLRTGDVGTLDDDGHLFIVDRLKDLIISGGENISPREVEEALYAHPAVAECAVVGIPDERWGEQVRAVVVLKPGQQADAAALIQCCAEQLAKYKVPRSVVFAASLPRDPVGKIQKRLIRDQYSGPPG